MLIFWHLRGGISWYSFSGLFHGLGTDAVDWKCLKLKRRVQEGLRYASDGGIEFEWDSLPRISAGRSCCSEGVECGSWREDVGHVSGNCRERIGRACSSYCREGVRHGVWWAGSWRATWRGGVRFGRLKGSSQERVSRISVADRIKKGDEGSIFLLRPFLMLIH